MRLHLYKRWQMFRWRLRNQEFWIRGKPHKLSQWFSLPDYWRGEKL